MEGGRFVPDVDACIIGREGESRANNMGRDFM